MQEVMKKLYKFSGAGNDFVVIDGREGDVSAFREVPRIEALCKEFKTDGLMILGPALRQAQGPGTEQVPELVEGPAEYLFRAPDGLHTGEILERPDGSTGSPTDRWTVRIKMIDVQGITPMLGGYFLNTGTRHFVKFVEDVEQVDVDAEGKALRWNEAFAPIGTNVNFVHVAPDGLHVRTFEKGVEGETLACGTGLPACALVAHHAGVPTATPGAYRLRARQDWLSVNFTPGADEKFTDVYLTGPARLVEIR